MKADFIRLDTEKELKMRYEYCVAGKVDDLESLLSYIKSLHSDYDCYRLGPSTVIDNSHLGDIELLQLGTLDEACVFFKVYSEENFQIKNFPVFMFFPEICEAKYSENGIKYSIYRFSGLTLRKDDFRKSKYKDRYQSIFAMGQDRRNEASKYEIERALASLD